MKKIILLLTFIVICTGIFAYNEVGTMSINKTSISSK